MGTTETPYASWPHIDLRGLFVGQSPVTFASSFQLRLPLGRQPSRSGCAALQRSFEALPRPLLKQVLRFPVRHAPLLALLERCEGAKDLVHNNPPLALLITAHDRLAPRPGLDFWAEAERLVRLPQRDALGELGFPRMRRTVRILRKLEPECWALPRLLRLRDAFRDPEVVKTLAHTRRIPASVLLVLCDTEARPHISPATIADLAADEHVGGAAFGRTLLRLLRFVHSWGLSDRIGCLEGLLGGPGGPKV